MGQPLSLGSLLEAIRVGEEQSLAVFATRMGIARGNLCDIEKERRKVRLDRAAAWVKLLGYARSRSHRAASRRAPHPPSRSGYGKSAHLQGLIAYRGLSLVSQVAKYYYPEMAQPVELSDDLVLDARLQAKLLSARSPGR